jgi:hypothetical protein
MMLRVCGFIEILSIITGLISVCVIVFLHGVAQQFAFAKHGAGAVVDSAWEQRKPEATLREILEKPHAQSAVPGVQSTLC